MSADLQKTKPGRLAFLAICFAVMAVLLSLRLFYWQVLHRNEVLQSNNTIEEVDISAIGWRGTVYDRSNHALAVPSLVYDVGASPQLITDTMRVAGLLAPLVHMPEPELVAKLSQKVTYVPLARSLSAIEGETIRELDLLGIRLDPRPGRYYPEGSLAATVLGFVGGEGRGMYGVEQQYDARLRGTDGTKHASGPQLLFNLPFDQPPRNGTDLVLTIDRAIQYSAEKNLQQALRDYEAESGSIIVMDPRTGAILAMAVLPSFDPNAYASAPSASAYVNKTISEQYEPGSVFKVVTMAAALDAGAVRPNDTYLDRGRVVVGGRVFQNWDGRAYGLSTMTDILAHSLNLGAIEVAQRLGADRFYAAVRRFGFGQPTGIDLPGEVAGSVREPGSPDWWPADLATNSFGQGLAATPLQMLAAVATVANKGVLMRPYVVDRMVENGRVVWQASPQPVRRVISAVTADTLTGMLVEALPRETSLAVVPGYTTAGKTGTAQIPTQSGYEEDAVIASFAGYIPAKDPRLAVLVKLDRPKREAWGSRAAAPVFRKVALEVCAYLGIPPDQAQVTGQ